MILLMLLFGAVYSFTSAVGSYNVKYYPESNVYTASNENYNRLKCTTCCRVLFASEYNYAKNAKFTDADDIKDYTRFVMDNEFDDRSLVRAYEGGWEQNILLRPLKPGNELQFWEFAPYKMYISFPIPRRVHDIRGTADPGNTLIIWNKKPPLAEGTKNQRFVYVHPYNGYPSNEKYSIYKQHFYIPFQTAYSLCYQTKTGGETRSTWDGNRNLQTTTTSYQIKAERCSPTDPKQMFVPVFA
ncbi:hypothetical protein EIN_476150 [Entamoeba invadens IP1]|uniref:Galactose-inhibitable lectin 35 kDa subunit n=1 Tax=Entamoeba invadens IP1 TaxID=370355 RepID=A0A0A1U3V7_ENTIV|nr:hypothetical protein EIN_476150 [Entamoeba invadens IP1]ELP88903.1 hypothetical protein EIN_476150 [Entamoeba invadens IP1]|eukprot:XP_004255674.1 hypothetical protein EIN_476150 [Entamoeba invadens IP1]